MDRERTETLNEEDELTSYDAHWGICVYMAFGSGARFFDLTGAYGIYMNLCIQSLVYSVA